MQILDLVQHLETKDPKVRSAAILELQLNGTEEILDRVLLLGKHGNYKAREAAAAVLGFMEITDRTKLREVVVLLAVLAFDDGSIRVRRSALSALGGRYAHSPLHRRYILSLLADAVQDPEATIRLSASEALSNVLNKKAIPLIETLLDDPDEGVLDWTAFYLQFTKLDSEGIRKRLVGMLDRSDGDARREAIYALARLKDRRVTPALHAELSKEFIRFRMLEAAGDLGDPTLLCVLKDIKVSFAGDRESEGIADKQYQRLKRKARGALDSK